MAADPSLTNAALIEAANFLAGRDPDLRRVLESYGPPPLWARPPGFPTLLYIILEQQVSLASARAAFVRLNAAVEELTPENFLLLDDAALLRIGFSRQKASYGRNLARLVSAGELDLPGLEQLDDEQARDVLLRVKGIGPWTAEVYLLMALLRPDAWPRGDLALAQAVRQVKHLETLPGPDELERMGEAWRPWRAVAARLFWHDYLSRSRNSG